MVTYTHYFNPRTLAGATAEGKSLGRRAAISIHAPLRVRLERATDGAEHGYISIHAPLRVRPALSSTSTNAVQFQSTHPYGCDKIHPTQKQIGLLISIHAPLRVRQNSPDAEANRIINFNPRTLTGATS